MGRPWIALACVAALAGGSLTACQPLYGGKPEKLKNPEKKKKPPEPPESAEKVIYVEDCVASFSGDATKLKRDTVKANTLLDEGDAALQSAQKTTDPAAQGGFLKEAVDKYRNALTKDPYSVSGTVKLAQAYDLVRRKGCALAMLKRLASMETHAPFDREAKRTADEIADNPSLFKGYRKDAINALGE